MTIVSAGPHHIHDVFMGNIPPSLESEWLKRDPELKDAVLKAYRYAFKLLFDQVTIGEYENFDELKVGMTHMSVE
jgi:hypothetical protein